jgi:hypothetical protein
MARLRPALCAALAALSLSAGSLSAGSLSACGRGETPGPVRTPLQASEAAQRALRSAGLNEQVVAVQRQGEAWLVVTRWPQTSMAGHLVTVDAASGRVRVERYRSIQIGQPRRAD